MMSDNTFHFHWFSILLLAIIAMVFGGFALFYISFRMYKTNKLSSFILGGLIGNMLVGIAFSWGILYFITDVVFDLVKFETNGFDEKILFISLIFAIVITNTLSVIVLIKRNLDRRPMVNDLSQDQEG